jgi:hypothetical protein
MSTSVYTGLTRSLSVGAFTKLRKRTISSVVSVCLSVRMGQLGSHWTDVHEISYWIILWKLVEKNSSFIKIWPEYRVLNMKTYVVNLCNYLAEILLEWEMFQTKVVEKIKTNIICSITLFRKSCRLGDNVEKQVQPDRPQMTT